MTQNKNRYVLVEEVNQLIKNIPEKYGKEKEIILLVSEEGFKIKDAIKKCGYSKEIRTLQYHIHRASKGIISLQDLRRSYLWNHPKVKKRNLKRKKISLKMRWEVLSRNGFRCVCCGTNSTEEVLHVDHIIPASLGGKTELNNLRTLCSSCNLGRGNRFLLDLRLVKEMNNG